MIFRVPTSTDPLVTDYDQRTVFDGQEYSLRFRFNERSGYWYLDIADVDGVPIVSGRKLVRGAAIFGRSAGRFPGGQLYVIGASDPGVSDLGDAVTLYYVSAATFGRPSAGGAVIGSVGIPGGGGPPSDL